MIFLGKEMDAESGNSLVESLITAIDATKQTADLKRDIRAIIKERTTAELWGLIYSIADSLLSNEKLLHDGMINGLWALVLDEINAELQKKIFSGCK